MLFLLTLITPLWYIGYKFSVFSGGSEGVVYMLIQQKRLLYLFLSLSVISNLACGSASFNFPFNKTEKISDILSSPSKYSGKLVNVKGKVTEFFIALEVGYFVISDGTDSIVIIPSRTFPKVGEEVKIKGTVKNAFVIGDKSLTVIVEEE